MSNANDYVKKKLLEKYDNNEEGEWEIYGEDPNCDMGGPHIEPFLGQVTGRYADVVEYAIHLSGFFSWGSGGRINKARRATKAIPRNYKHDEKARKEAAVKIKELEAEIVRLKNEYDLFR